MYYDKLRLQLINNKFINLLYLRMKILSNDLTHAFSVFVFGTFYIP